MTTMKQEVLLVKIFMANHALNCESMRDLTTCENNG